MVIHVVLLGEANSNDFRNAILSSIECELVKTFTDEKAAIDSLYQIRPSIIILQLDYFKEKSTEIIRDILKKTFVPILVVTTSSSNSQLIIDCLDAGAIDFVHHPLSNSLDRLDYIKKIKVASNARHQEKEIATPRPIPKMRKGSPKIVVVATSTGGPSTLEKFFKDFPKDFPFPILVVQHMPAGFTQSLAQRLNSICEIEIKEAQEGEIVKPGVAYIAPGNYHMKIVGSISESRITINQDPREEGVRPCANFLFESASSIFKENTIGIVLTGMGQDGLRGSKIIKERLGTILAQSEKTSVIYGMPKAVVDARLADMQVDLEQMVVALAQLIEV